GGLARSADAADTRLETANHLQRELYVTFATREITFRYDWVRSMLTKLDALQHGAPLTSVQLPSGTFNCRRPVHVSGVDALALSTPPVACTLEPSFTPSATPASALRCMSAAPPVVTVAPFGADISSNPTKPPSAARGSMKVSPSTAKRRETSGSTS